MKGEVPAEYVGPKMAALREERRRRFAFIMGCGEMNGRQAAIDAGYADSAGGSAKVTACELMQDPRIIAAVNEVARKVLDGLAPLAIKAAKAILVNPKHPHHARMIETMLDRTGYVAETAHKVTVEHTVDMRELEELARRLALENGIAPEKFVGINGVKTIEGTVNGKQQDGAAAADSGLVAPQRE
jgi:hypothetical protein